MSEVEQQVLYLGRWVSRDHFKTFVYKRGEKHLAKSYQEFSQLISSGVWHVEPVPDLEIIEACASIQHDDNKIIGITHKKTKRAKKCPNPHKA